MNRPTVNSEMKQAAAEELASEMLKSGLITECQRTDLARSLAQHGSLYADGFEFGKYLDRHSWPVNAEWIEHLESYGSILREKLNAAGWEWVRAEDIQPPLPIGTIINEGEITGIYEHMPAYYQVKPLGQDDEKEGHRRKLIKFEDAIAA